jgi:MarR-like DNA-binding transcriptional regulator SgrR of sgrS sRNA
MAARRKRAAAAAAALVLSFVGDAGAASRPRVGGKLVGSLLGEPTTLDPTEAQTHGELSLVSLVFDSLYAIDGEGRVSPHLASAMPALSPDGLTARIALYPGALFHGGSVVTAADVVASLQRLAGSARTGWLMAPIASVREEAGDVVIALRRPLPEPELAELLSSPHASITHAGRAPRWSGDHGTGPFRIVEMSTGKRRVRLVAWDRHFAGPPYLGELELRWFGARDEEAKNYEAGNADLSFRGEIAFAGHKPKYRTRHQEGPATLLVYLGFGTRTKAVTKLRFRRAVSLAVNRDGLKNIGSGERVVLATSAAARALGGPAAIDTDTAARREQAKQALAGLAASPGKAIEVLVDRSRPDDRAVGEKVVSALLRIGVSAQVAETDARSFARRVAAGECDVYVGQLAPPAADPVLQLAGAFAVGRDDWARGELEQGTLNLLSAVGSFESRLPIVPLFHRAIRVHHLDNVYVDGTAFDAMSRLAYANLFVDGKPARSP